MSIFHHFSSNFSMVLDHPLVRSYALSMPFHRFSHTDHMNMLCHIYQNPSSIPLNPLTNNLLSSIASMNDNLCHLLMVDHNHRICPLPIFSMDNHVYPQNTIN